MRRSAGVLFLRVCGPTAGSCYQGQVAADWGALTAAQAVAGGLAGCTAIPDPPRRECITIPGLRTETLGSGASRESTPLLKKPAPPPDDGAPTWHDVAVCALAYAVATLFVLSPLRSVFGSSGSKHTVATTAVWFHPVRTRGNLIEVLYYTLRLLMLALAACLGATGSIQLFYLLHMPRPAITALLVCWLAVTLGIIGVLKVRANNQSFNTASSAAIIFLVSVLLREDDAQHGALSFDTVLNYLEMVATGALISSVASVLFYRKTSLALLHSKCSELAETYAEMLDLIVAEFGERPDPHIVATNTAANIMLSQINQHGKYARYEQAFRRDSQQFSLEMNEIASLERQSMHLGGMLHCASVASDFRGIQQSQLRGLRRVMRRYSSELARFVRNGRRPEDKDSMNQCLVQYTHARDDVLRSPSPESAGSGLDNSLHATSILFADLLQDVGYEMTANTARSRGLPTTKPQQRPVVAAKFSQLSEALLPTRKPAEGGLGPKLWKLLRLLRNLDVRHGIRVGFGALVLSLPAYIPAYRPLFQKWHGEWTVITYMIIMARNLGAMTHNIPLRIVGTSIGALVGIAANWVGDGNPIILFFIGVAVSLGCYRRILSKKDPVFGRFILLSYNLVCLYGFSVAMDAPDDDYYDVHDPIYDVAFHRVVSVCIGVLWAVFITVTIWPHSARQALRLDLCIQWMRMGIAWKSDPLDVSPYTTSAIQPAAHGSASPSVRFRGIVSVHELQLMMLDLDTLLKNSPNEFRLRGKFDPAPYKQMIESTQIILDAFHSISILIEDDPVATAREHDLVKSTQPERKELSHLIFLQFYTASASVRLGFPVPDYLPDIQRPLDRLAAKVREGRQLMGAPEPSGPLSQENYDFVLFYSYLTVLLTVSSQLKRIHEALRDIFGSLDNDFLFENV